MGNALNEDGLKESIVQILGGARVKTDPYFRLSSGTGYVDVESVWRGYLACLN